MSILGRLKHVHVVYQPQWVSEEVYERWKWMVMRTCLVMISPWYDQRWLCFLKPGISKAVSNLGCESFTPSGISFSCELQRDLYSLNIKREELEGQLIRHFRNDHSVIYIANADRSVLESLCPDSLVSLGTRLLLGPLSDLTTINRQLINRWTLDISIAFASFKNAVANVSGTSSNVCLFAIAQLLTMKFDVSFVEGGALLIRPTGTDVMVVVLPVDTHGRVALLLLHGSDHSTHLVTTIDTKTTDCAHRNTYPWDARLSLSLTHQCRIRNEFSWEKPGRSAHEAIETRQRRFYDNLRELIRLHLNGTGPRVYVTHQTDPFDIRPDVWAYNETSDEIELLPPLYIGPLSPYATKPQTSLSTIYWKVTEIESYCLPHAGLLTYPAAQHLLVGDEWMWTDDGLVSTCPISPDSPVCTWNTRFWSYDKDDGARVGKSFMQIVDKTPVIDRHTFDKDWPTFPNAHVYQYHLVHGDALQRHILVCGGNGSKYEGYDPIPTTGGVGRGTRIANDTQMSSITLSQNGRTLYKKKKEKVLLNELTNPLDSVAHYRSGTLAYKTAKRVIIPRYSLKKMQDVVTDATRCILSMEVLVVVAGYMGVLPAIAGVKPIATKDWVTLILWVPPTTRIVRPIGSDTLLTSDKMRCGPVVTVAIVQPTLGEDPVPVDATWTDAISAIHTSNPVIYSRGQETVPDRLDTDIHTVCTSGISMHLRREQCLRWLPSPLLEKLRLEISRPKKD